MPALCKHHNQTLKKVMHALCKTPKKTLHNQPLSNLTHVLQQLSLILQQTDIILNNTPTHLTQHEIEIKQTTSKPTPTLRGFNCFKQTIPLNTQEVQFLSKTTVSCTHSSGRK